MTKKQISMRNLHLPTNIIHISTSYQVASNPLFDSNDIVFEVLKDSVNLESIVVELDYNIHEIYYARLKIHFDDGSSYGWLKAVAMSKGSEGFAHCNTIINTPIVTTDTDANNAKLGNFNLMSSAFTIYSGTGEHSSTTWSIKDLAGNLLWERKDDKHNLTRVRIPNESLDSNSIYTVEVVYRSKNNVISNKGKLIIKTGGASKLVEVLDTQPIAVGGDCSVDGEDFDCLLEMVVSNTAIGVKLECTDPLCGVGN